MLPFLPFDVFALITQLVNLWAVVEVILGLFGIVLE